MKYIKLFENFDGAAHKKMVLYHGVKDPAVVADILKNGFDLSRIKPLWTNDLAVSTLTTPKAVKRFFGDKGVQVLRLEFDGVMCDWEKLKGIYAKTPQEYTKQVIDSGIDAVKLGGDGARQVFVYNPKAIKKITKI